MTQEDSGDDVTRDARDRGEQEDTMGIRMQDRDREVFVIVNYDFEYITEDGKEVWMKEGEILLLLSRTNNDWWQVCLKRGHDIYYQLSLTTQYACRIWGRCQTFNGLFINENEAWPKVRPLIV